MEIREYTKYNEEEILRLYTAVGWTAYTENMPALREGFKNSMLVLAAYDGEELLGLIRAVGDGATIVFVQDILVFPDKQRQGIGTTLLKAILDRYPDVRQIELATDNTPKTVAFYRSMGFSEMSEIGCCGFMRCREAFLSISYRFPRKNQHYHYGIGLVTSVFRCYNGIGKQYNTSISLKFFCMPALSRRGLLSGVTCSAA